MKVKINKCGLNYVIVSNFIYKFANLDVTKLEKVSTFWRVEASIFLFVF